MPEPEAVGSYKCEIGSGVTWAGTDDVVQLGKFCAVLELDEEVAYTESGSFVNRAGIGSVV